MAYGLGIAADIAVFADEMNGCRSSMIERTATIELRPFIGSLPQRTMMDLASLPKTRSARSA